MEQYINKSALVAEIESRIKSMEECFNGKFPMSQSVKETEQDKGKLVAYKLILSFIDTLEVKEVDLEKKLDEWIKYGPHTNYPWCTIPDAIKITAEHFFELGLKAAQKEE